MLCGVLLEVSLENYWRWTVTDSYRILQVQSEPGGIKWVRVGVACWKNIEPTGWGTTGTVELQVGMTNFVAKNLNRTVSTTLIEGEFPSIASILANKPSFDEPSKFPTPCLNIELLVGTLRAADLLSGRTKKEQAEVDIYPEDKGGLKPVWFDVRSAGQPAKSMFLTRLIKFHTMEGGAARQKTFRERRIDAIEKLRPPRIPYFDLRVDVSPYTKRLSAVVDRGIVGVKDEIKTAVEARLIVKRTSGEDPEEVHEFKAPFVGNFATFLCDATNIVAGEAYEVTVLAFDENMKIVGEQTETKPFINLTATSDLNTPVKGESFQMMAWQNKELGIASVNDASGRPGGLYMRKGAPELRFERLQITPWLNNKLGLEDRVW
jgi:hypothetical protein